MRYFVAVFSPGDVRGGVTGGDAQEGSDAAGPYDLITRGFPDYGRV